MLSQTPFDLQVADIAEEQQLQSKLVITLTPFISTAIAMSGDAISNEDNKPLRKEDDAIAASIAADEDEIDEEASTSISARALALIARFTIFPALFHVAGTAVSQFVQASISLASVFVKTAFRLATTAVSSFTGTIIPMISAAGSAVGSLLAWLLGTPAGWAVLGIGAVAAGGVYLYKKLKEDRLKMMAAKAAVSAVNTVGVANSYKIYKTVTGKQDDMEVIVSAATPILMSSDAVQAVQTIKSSNEAQLVYDTAIKAAVAVKSSEFVQAQTANLAAKYEAVRQQVTHSNAYQAAKPIVETQIIPVVKTASSTVYDKAQSFSQKALDKAQISIFNAQDEIIETMRKEGWDKMDTSSPDNYSKFGINFSKTRSKEFIRNLTAEQAFDIYKKEYWDAANVDAVSPVLQRAYFNTAVNMGVGTAKKLLARSDGTLEGFSTEKWKYYSNLVKANPYRYGKYLKGWRRRVINEYNESLALAQNFIEQQKQRLSQQQISMPTQSSKASNYQIVKSSKKIMAVEV